MKNLKRSLIVFLFLFTIFNPFFVYAVPADRLTNPSQAVSGPKGNWKVDIIRREKAEPLRVFILDVGQGDSIFMEFPYGETMLVDAGSWDSYGIPHLKNFLNDYFREHSYKNNTIDVVVASHPDYDHIKGLRDIIKNYRVNWYIDNGQPASSTLYKSLMKTVKFYDEKDKTDYIAIKENNPEFDKNGLYNFANITRFKDAEVYILGSYKGEGKQDLNNASIVMKIVYGRTSVLLTGDSEGKNLLKENEYIKADSDKYEENRIYKRLKDKNRLDMLDSDALKVGHHGSHNSATEVYLSEATPEISVISVGDYRVSSHARRFGHPRLETLERLAKYTSGKREKQLIKAYKDSKTQEEFSIEKAVYLTANEHQLKRKSIDRFGDIIILLDGDKVSKVN